MGCRPALCSGSSAFIRNCLCSSLRGSAKPLMMEPRISSSSAIPRVGAQEGLGRRLVWVRIRVGLGLGWVGECRVRDRVRGRVVDRCVARSRR